MRDGIAPGERNLYPAMPFVFSHITTPDDIDALYAYNMSIPAMPIANKSNTGVFVLPVRPFMDFWTLLNFPDRKVSCGMTSAPPNGTGEPISSKGWRIAARATRRAIS